MNNLNEHDRREIEALKQDEEHFKQWKEKTKNMTEREKIILFTKGLQKTIDKSYLM